MVPVGARHRRYPAARSDRLIAALQLLAPCFGYSTLSHSGDNPRFRLVLHLNCPVDAREAKALAKVLSRHLTEALGVRVLASMAEAEHGAPPFIVLDGSMQSGSHIAFGPVDGFIPIPLQQEPPDPLDVTLWVPRSVPNKVAKSESAVLGFVGRPQTPKTVAALRDALGRLDKRYPDAVHDREIWLKKVMTSVAAHNWGDVGRSIAEEWSRQSPKYDAERFDVDWRSLKPEGGITAATVYWLAGPSPDEDCPDLASHDGMACRFSAWLGGRVIFARSGWHLWTGSHWKPDKTPVEGLLKDYAREYARHALEDYMADPENNFAKSQNKAAKSLLSVDRQRAVLDALRVMLTVPDDQLDGDPMLLAVLKGMVDLRTGTLMAADPLTYCTRSAGVAFDATIQCSGWQAFLKQTFPDDIEKIGLLQRWFGYCLTGRMDEEKLLYIMGTYCVTADPNLLMTSRRDAGSASPDLMTLIGARLCLLNESKAGAHRPRRNARLLASGNAAAVSCADSQRATRPWLAGSPQD
jgi:hypothetical protein